MKMINKILRHIEDELHDAEEYASKYFEYKMYGQNERASVYRTLAEDELRHSTLLHSIAVEDIERLKQTYTPPQYMMEIWNETHKKYMEKEEMIVSLLK